MKTIYIVDDHPVLREGLVSIIDRNPEHRVCGSADTAAAAMAGIAETRPDVVMLDISLPDKSGLEVIKDLLSQYPDLKILVFSMHDELLYAERVMRAGASGYLMKGAAAGRIAEALGRVLSGEPYLSGSVSNHILRGLSTKSGRNRVGVGRLSDRELEVFELIGRGIPSARIAGHLFISQKTVDAHRANIKTKLSLPDASSLIREAVLWVELVSNERLEAAAAE
jgi:DNA-binding NarL/FixJ family response regulator